MNIQNDGTFKSYFKDEIKHKDKKRYKIPVRKDRSTTGLKQALATKWGYKSQVELFDHLWQTSLKNGKVICPFTGEVLNKFYDTALEYNCCAHILPKSKYPLYKLNIHNVVLCHPMFHAIVDQGRISDRAHHPTWKFDYWDALQKSMKLEYEQFIKENL